MEPRRVRGARFLRCLKASAAMVPDATATRPA